MTNKRLLSILLFSSVLGMSCKNTLNVQAPYKDVTVVYGLIDQNDNIHYFRINKAFEGIGNAYSMAQQYDSIYYPVGTISVVLQDSNPTTNAIYNYNLDTTTTIPLGPGTFSYPKQLLYYTNASLNTNDYYNLIVTNNKTGKKLRGSTTLLQDLQYTSVLGQRTLGLGNNPNPTVIQWNSTPNGRIYQMTLLFYYDNQVGNGNRVLQAPLELVFPPQIASSLSGGSAMSYSVSAQQLYTFIVGSLKYEPGVTRYADSLGIIFTTGSDDLNTYLQLSQPPMGINQDVPSFSDVTNGVGLYTARHVEVFHYNGISSSMLDSLTQEQRFINLGFQL
jgi:hypothetical protein